MGLEETLPCRHQFDQDMAGRLRALIRNLARTNPDLLRQNDIDPGQYPLLLNSAIQSLRGTIAATTSKKYGFLEKIFDYLRDNHAISDWTKMGAQGRNDFKVVLSEGYSVSVEAKGCPDGNNMTIWERPSWANEFVVWSQCPDSLVNEPGEGLWSGISTRLVPKIITERNIVDAVVFYDGRCGSSLRPCPKSFGIFGDLRAAATVIHDQDDLGWMPPPSIFLMPQTQPHFQTNTSPPMHTIESCRFARVLLSAFNVPEEEMKSYVHGVKLELKIEGRNQFRKVRIYRGNDPKPCVEGRWTKLKRE